MQPLKLLNRLLSLGRNERDIEKHEQIGIYSKQKLIPPNTQGPQASSTEYWFVIVTALQTLDARIRKSLLLRVSRRTDGNR